MGPSTLLCLVVAIADGDTLTARCESEFGQQTVIVRLSQIDAPEMRQPWGEHSRKNLVRLCLGKAVTAHEESKDRNQRVVARVVCEGVDANAEQVRAGMAWVFDRYVTDRSLYALQSESRELMRGLWADASPVPPWEWRKGVRSRTE